MTTKNSVWIHGHSGRMGQALKLALGEHGAKFTYLGGSAETFETNDALSTKPFDKQTLSERLDQCGIVLDFSTPAANALLADVLSLKPRSGQAVLIGTTGLDSQAMIKWQKIAQQQNLRIMHAPNTSLGILVLSRITQDLTKLLQPQGFDLEISEAHHRGKKDAPSGTALLLAKTAQAANPNLTINSSRTKERSPNEIGVQAIRGGNIFGEHTVMFLGNHEEIHLSHRALSRSLFAEGALTLGAWLKERPAPGFYHLSDVELKDLL